MVPIRGEWIPFHDLQDQLDHYRLWGLIPEKSKQLRTIMVTDGYLGVPEPCRVVGYQTDTWAVIELEDGFHAIYGEYLAELQPESYQRLPRGICFADILAKYVVFDIETTGFDFHKDDIIEIAAIRYEYGREVARFHSLVNPHTLLPSNIVSLTGITQEDVDLAPALDAVSSGFFNFIGNLPLVGHNAVSFDGPFLSAKMGQLDNAIIDTLPMARKMFSLLSCHKLEYLKDVLQLNNSGSHRALQDVETTNALLWACLAPRRYETNVFRSLLFDRGRTPRTKPAKVSSKSAKFEHVDIKSITPSGGSVDLQSPLYGKNVVFTGTLSIPREQAMQLAVDAGAVLKTTISVKTHYLVVGRQDKALVGDDGMSTKEEKAHMINQSGKAQIKIINEHEFLDLVMKEGAGV